MELKSYEANYDSAKEDPFNRTFMELKYGPPDAFAQRHSLLIAPLWNWNIIYEPVRYEHVAFNRTFMELKSVGQEVRGVLSDSF